MLAWHAHGEELAIFTALEDVAPDVAEAYENMTRIWRQVMPADAFAGATQLVEKAIGDDYAELTRRMPELAGAH